MIDWDKIDKFVAEMKKPPYVAVDEIEWRNALEAYRETLPEGFDGSETTEFFWHLIYFSAMAFCRGMEYAEVKAGTRKESLYPRY